MIKQPNSRMCFACGLENPAGLHLHFYDNGVDEVAAEFTIQPDHQGYPGVAHGGVVAAILDELGGRTVMIGNPIANKEPNAISKISTAASTPTSSLAGWV